MIQVASYPPGFALVRVPSRGSPRGICVGKIGNVNFFLLCFDFPLSLSFCQR